MEPADDGLLRRSYPERQFIVVDSDDAVAALRRTESADSTSGVAAEVIEAASKAATPGNLAASVAGGAVYAAAYLWKARKRAHREHLPLLVVSTSQAASLTFPYGPPLARVVYVGDPGIAGKYYPVSGFHRYMFQAKVAEAQKLLIGLGATEISIEYVEGFGREAGGDLAVAGSEDAGGGSHATSNRRSRAESTMRLAPTKPPHIPDGLVWFSSEPLWRAVADARLESGLLSYSLEVNYTEDFGINANLNAKIANVGLEAGGKFQECRATTWRLNVTFAEDLPPETTDPAP